MIPDFIPKLVIQKQIGTVFCLLLSVVCFAQRPVLFPEPKSVTFGNGQFLLSRLTIYESPTADKDVAFALGELKKVIVARTGKLPRKAVSPKTATFSFSILEKGQEIPGNNEARPENKREAYSLTITKESVKVTATTSTGLFYAVQTIRQLLQGTGANAALSVAKIDDTPAIPYRGVMMDFAHGGLLTVDEIKRQIDFLSRWKSNQYYFYNEVSIELDGFPTLNYLSGYSKEQIHRIIAYARERHMDVIPFVNFYGHLHELIRHEKFASLAIGQYGHELDPRNPEVQKLLKNWTKQYAELFPTPFIHIGFDETWETKRIARDINPQLDPEELFIRQLNFVNEEFKQFGKTALAWTDMNSFYPKVIEKFPKDVIPVIWEYTPDTAAISHYLNPVLKEKFNFFIQPAVSGWGHIYPNTNYTFDNIDLCLKAGMKNKTLGFITSVWTDSVEPFVRASWMFMAYGCIGAWQGTAPDKATFIPAYTTIAFPTAAEEMAQAFSKLEASGTHLFKCLGKNTGGMPRGTLVESWSNPFSPYYLKNTVQHLEDFRLARKSSEEAQHYLIQALRKTQGQDSLFINSLYVSARLITYSASRFLWAKAIADRWDEAMILRKKEDYVTYDLTYPCHGLLVDAMDETGELKSIYAKTWQTEYIPYRMNTILGRFDVEYGLWRKLLLKVNDYHLENKATPGLPVKPFNEMFKPDF
jgi:hexosaminidase